MVACCLPRNKFNPIGNLGKGFFGNVILARNKLLGRVEAVKEIYLPNPRFFPGAMKEAETLQKLKHRNIVEVYDAGFLNSQRGIYISMEFLKNGSIQNISFISIINLKRICLDVLSALEYAHSRNYIHRDVKPNNILIADDNTSKLSDFGIATQLDARGTAIPFGYKKHLAPEIFRGERCSISSDIYAMGVTMHRMINGDPNRLEKMNDAQFEHAILIGEYPSRKKYRPDTPSKIIKIINKALEINPNDRFSSAKAMADELRRVQIKCKWIRTEKGAQAEWEGRTNSKVIKIFYSEMEGKIITKQKRLETGMFRKINKFCYSNLKKSEVAPKLHYLLIGFESGRFH